MKITYLQLLNIIDGRLFTNISDVTDFYDFVFNESFMIYHLPTVHKYLIDHKPLWFKQLEDHHIEKFNFLLNNNDFMEIYKYFTENKQEDVEIFNFIFEDKNDFYNYMITNSLLNTLSKYK